MQELTVTATIAVRGGPLWKLSTHLKPQIYEVASLPLGGDAGETVTVLPEAAEASLLAVRAVSAAGAAAKVTVTPVGVVTTGSTAEDKDGTPLTVDGNLLVTNEGVIAGLVEGELVKLKVKNPGTEPVEVSVLVAFKT